MRNSKGVIQGLGLLGLSVAGALLLQSHGTVPSASANSSAVSGSATGDSIGYQYGNIQVKVTEANGKITAVDLVQADATAGREQAFSYLVKDAISANGTSFGNLSGATFTTDAFKQALESALSKLA
ncbi:MAG: FMN-binding protein [Micrococcales bacterium]